MATLCGWKKVTSNFLDSPQPPLDTSTGQTLMRQPFDQTAHLGLINLDTEALLHSRHHRFDADFVSALGYAWS
jgi:hypothetical protein